MPIKNKNNQIFGQAAEIAQHAGMILMTVAATIGMLELPDHPTSKVALSGMQPAYAFAGQEEQGGNTQRREREESGPHYISYSVAQRTPARSGRS